MNTLSAGDFKRYVAGNKFSKIIFNSEDQVSYALCLPTFFKLEFNCISISLCPDIISLSGACGIICFNNITKIEVEEFAVGSVIRLSCKNDTGFLNYNLLFI